MGKFRIGGLTAALVMALSVTVWCWSYDVRVGGSNDPSKPTFGLQGTAWTSEYLTVSGSPYTQVRLDGYTSFVGSNGTGYCFTASSCAYAEARANIVPFGTYWATSRHYVGGVFKGERQASKTFNDPPSGCTGSDCPNSPIVIPTGNSQAIKLTRAADGVIFDINADGAPILTAWTKAGTEVAFLALDRNGNGTIDSGAELFGDATLPGVSNGFAALRLTGQHNQDGGINAADELYAKLLLWTDRNHNGYSEPDELQPFSDVFEAIGLGYTYAPRRDGFGNEYRYQGFARTLGSTPAEAREIKIFDVFLAAQ